MIGHDRRQLVDDMRTAVADKKSEAEVLSTAVELINGFSDGYNWTGFYMMRDGVLRLGPYRGPKTPHTEIELNRGICGAAASEKRTLIVDDVKSDPRFLACSLTTRSEIVVPLMKGEECIGEIDIDSDQPAFFSSQDREMLEAIADVIVKKLDEVG